MKYKLLPAASLVALGLAAQPAAAQENISAYTDLNLDECTVHSSDDMGSTWSCSGYKGIPVMVGEGDLRFFISYGLKSTEEKAAQQTLPPFNHPGQKIEWRLSNASGSLRPVATILRFFTQREEGEDEAEILVVTKVETGSTCHVAYIDATANTDANELARGAADDIAPDFDCENQPQIVGDFEAWQTE
jgi:hypothetical protein